MALPKRKPLRMQGYDYNTPDLYFITICTDKKQQLFWNENVGAVIGRPQDVPLNTNGKIVETAIKNISKHYPYCEIEHYVVMPDHIHLMIQIICDENGGRPLTAPTISTVINQLKGSVTKQLGFKVWQRSFYDHVIRSYADYLKHYDYIENNPVDWIMGKHTDTFN